VYPVDNLGKYLATLPYKLGDFNLAPTYIGVDEDGDQYASTIVITFRGETRDLSTGEMVPAELGVPWSVNLLYKDKVAT
jgi:hypothetical protein